MQKSLTMFEQKKIPFYAPSKVSLMKGSTIYSKCTHCTPPFPRDSSLQHACLAKSCSHDSLLTSPSPPKETCMTHYSLPLPQRDMTHYSVESLSWYSLALVKHFCTPGSFHSFIWPTNSVDIASLTAWPQWTPVVCLKSCVCVGWGMQTYYNITAFFTIKFIRTHTYAIYPILDNLYIV